MITKLLPARVLTQAKTICSKAQGHDKMYHSVGDIIHYLSKGKKLIYIQFCYKTLVVFGKVDIKCTA
jgi:hypothetical protein